jgi:hypothetical protein
MIVVTSNPAGAVTRLDLEALSVWRLELGATSSTIGVGIRYHTAGPVATALSIIAGVDVGDRAAAAEIVKKGISHHKGQAHNKSRLAESARILYNVQASDREVDRILERVPELVTVYFDVLGALQKGAESVGDFEDWLWFIGPGPLWELPKARSKNPETDTKPDGE